MQLIQLYYGKFSNSLNFDQSRSDNLLLSMNVSLQHIGYKLFSVCDIICSSLSVISVSPSALLERITLYIRNKGLRVENTLRWIHISPRIRYLSSRSGTPRSMQSSCSSIIVPWSGTQNTLNSPSVAWVFINVPVSV